MPENHYSLNVFQLSRLPAIITKAIGEQLTAVKASPLADKTAEKPIPILGVTFNIDKTGLTYVIDRPDFTDDDVLPEENGNTS